LASERLRMDLCKRTSGAHTVTYVQISDLISVRVCGNSHTVTYTLSTT
jgi:hypothetical protein